MPQQYIPPSATIIYARGRLNLALELLNFKQNISNKPCECQTLELLFFLILYHRSKFYYVLKENSNMPEMNISMQLDQY